MMSVYLLLYCNRPSLWTKDLPQGLKGGNHEMTTVVFHALLPTGLWEFDDTSSIYIRFGSPVLGNWHCDIGPMQKELRFGLLRL